MQADHAPTAAEALDLARQRNRPIVIDSQTTQSALVAANPDGKLNALLTPGPVRVRQVDGSWKPIDLSLTRRGKMWVPAVAGNDVEIGHKRVRVCSKPKGPARRCSQRTVLATVRLPAGQLAGYAAARTDSKAAALARVGWEPGQARSKSDPTISIVWPGRVPRPQIEGNTATFRNIRRGVDLELRVTEASVVPSFRIRRPKPARAALQLPLLLHGLKLRAAKGGGTVLIDAASRRIGVSGPAIVTSGSVSGPARAVPGAASPAVAPVKISTAGGVTTVAPRIIASQNPTALSIYSLGGLIHPTITSDTFVWQAAPTASGNTGTTDYVGNLFMTTRTLMNFDTSMLTGAALDRAGLGLYQSGGSGCEVPRLLVTTPASAWSSSVTWNTQPAQSGSLYGFSDHQGHVSGQDGACAPAWISNGDPPPGGLGDGVDITPLVAGWASGSLPKNGVELVSENEAQASDNLRSIANSRSGPPQQSGFNAIFSFLKPSTAPALNVIYRPALAPPTKLAMTPLAGSLTNTATPTVSATVPSGCAPAAACGVQFSVIGPDGQAVWTQVQPGQPGQVASAQVPQSANLADGVAYRLQARTAMGALFFSSTASAPELAFSLDQAGPDNPVISVDPVMDAGDWANPAPAAFNFTLSANGAAAFNVREDGVTAPNAVVVGGSANVSWNPPSGLHTIEVWAVDAAGNRSGSSASFQFGSGGAGFSAPTSQARAASVFYIAAAAPVKTGDLARPVEASWQPQGGGSWTPLTAGLLSNGGEWDRSALVQDAALQTPPDLVWDTSKTPDVGAGPVLVNLKLCFTFLIDAANPECAVQPMQIVRHGFGGNFAAAPAGPATVSLQTGEMQVSASDAALPGTTVTTGRVWLSDAGGTAGIYGPGWQASLPSPSIGAAASTVINNSAQGVIILQSPGGSVATYVKAGGGPGTYEGAGLTAQSKTQLVYAAGSPQTMTLTDTGGNTTTFSSPDGVTWAATQVDGVGPHDVTALAFADDAYTAVTGVYASSGKETDCAALSVATAASTRGCRVLTVNLAPQSTTPPTDSQTGNYPGQVSSTTVQLWDSDTHQAGTPIVVAQYAYDSGGRLVSEWNPTQNTAKGPLLSQYTYNAPASSGGQPQLATLTPASAVTSGTPYFAPFSFDYGSDNRLTSVSRTNPDNSQTSQVSIVYDVALSGSGLPDLTPAATASWGQAASAAPTSATAIFGPDPNHTWSGTPSAPEADDWQYAGITYFNSLGAATNSAGYGAGAWQVSTTLFDEQQRATATLSAPNRDLALGAPCLAAAAVCSQSTTAQKAWMLETITHFDGTLQAPTDTWGPAFDGVTSLTAAGQVETIRSHAATTYNEGLPAGAAYANIVQATTIANSAARVGAVSYGAFGTDVDRKTTHTGFASAIGGTSGWLLREPTSTTVVMPGQDIVTQTKYNSTGNPVLVQDPGSNGNDSATRVNEYFTGALSSATAACANKPEWSGLICRASTANAGAVNAPPATTTTYTKWLQPATSTDTTSAGWTRVLTNSYDRVSSKPTGSSLSATGGSDQAVPAQTLGYDPETGGLLSVTAGSATISATFDHFGRQLTYTDAGGNTSTTTYDSASRPATFNDGKGLATYTYDSAQEHRSLVTSVDTGIGGGLPGTIGASYGPSGAPSVITYPNGVTATFNPDAAGHLVSKAYADHSGDTIAAWTQTFNAFSQVASDTGPCTQGQRTRDFGYDNDARLTTVADTCNGSAALRSYTFDAASRRTGLTATVGGGASTTVNTFDSASRLIATTLTGPAAGSGTFTYDSLGRTTALPAIAANGAGATLTYDASGQTVSITTPDTTQTFTRDPARRILTTNSTGSAGASLTNHYATGSGAPAWTSAADGSWTRNIGGPGGALALIAHGPAAGSAPAGADLQIIDPHGGIATTIPDTADVAAAKAGLITDYDEYGTPNNPNAPTPYGWAGGALKPVAPAGLVLLGARVYNPATGTFLTPDPVPAGNPNPYTYPPDPINGNDFTGTNWLGNAWGDATGWISHAWHDTTRWVSHAWHAVTGWASHTWHSITSGVGSLIGNLHLNFNFNFHMPSLSLRNSFAPLAHFALAGFGNWGMSAWHDVSHAVTDAGTWVWAHKAKILSTVSTATGDVAFAAAFIPGLQPFAAALLVVSVATGVAATVCDLADHNYVNAALDAAGVAGAFLGPFGDTGKAVGALIFQAGNFGTVESWAA